MLKVKSIVSVQVNGRDYDLYCAPDSPLPDAIEANSQIGAFLLGRHQQATEASKAQQSEKIEEYKPIEA